MRRTALLAVVVTAILGGCKDEGNAPWLTALTPETHGAFPLIGGAHGGIDCNECHGRFDTFTEFTCLDCHAHGRDETDANHAGLPGYGYDSRLCYECHPLGDVDGAGVEHERYFPIDDDSAHRTVGCSQCHLSREDRSQVDCAGCHEEGETAPFHVDVGGFEHVSTKCLRCHADSQVDRIGEHGPFRIASGTPHFREACLDCHPASRADKPYGADFRKSACTTCHEEPETDAEHPGVPGYAYESPACLLCHPDGSGEGVDHRDKFPIGAGTAHVEARCTECHQNPADPEAVTCTGCHESAETSAAHGPVGGYAHRSGECLRCHADSQVDRVAAHLPFVIGASSDHYRDACFDCHPGTRTDRPFPAIDFTSLDCLDCHDRGRMDDKHDDEPGYRYESRTCIGSGCHWNGRAPDDD